MFDFFPYLTQTDFDQAHKFKFSCSEIRLILLKSIKSAIQVPNSCHHQHEVTADEVFRCRRLPWSLAEVGEEIGKRCHRK